MARRPDVAAESTLERDYPAGYVAASDGDDQHQVLSVSRGLMEVGAACGSWMVPARHAFYRIADMPYHVRMHGEVTMSIVRFPHGLADGLPHACVVVRASLPCCALLTQIAGRGTLDSAHRGGRRLGVLLADLLQRQQMKCLCIPWPLYPEAGQVAGVLADDPVDPRSLVELAREVGLSARKLARDFREETGTSFREWRRRALLRHALIRLATEEPVATVARALGFKDQGFRAMFRRAMGVTPRRFCVEFFG